MYDVIVIGVGSMGSSTCYFLAKRGYKVLGLDQFDVPHDKGSHAGQSRIIRKAYFEHPDYVPLLNTAYDNWKDLESETKTQVYYPTGLVYFGPPGHEIIKGIKHAASLYNIPIEIIDVDAASKRFPQFSIPPGFVCLFEPDAGFVRPEKAISLYKEQAIQHGAVIQAGENVIEWEKTGNGIVVKTAKAIYHSEKLVVTAGAWAGKLIPGFSEKIKVTRQSFVWIQANNEQEFIMNRFPCWMIADDQLPGCFYGFPFLPPSEFGEPAGLKMAYHYPADVTDPDHVSRDTLPQDVNDVNYFLEKYMPDLVSEKRWFKTCLYGNSPDQDFIIDRLPGFEDRVSIACGFSGHGFKFVSAVGEILADFAIDGATKHPIEFLNAKRFG